MSLDSTTSNGFYTSSPASRSPVFTSIPPLPTANLNMRTNFDWFCYLMYTFHQISQRQLPKSCAHDSANLSKLRRHFIVQSCWLFNQFNVNSFIHLDLVNIVIFSTRTDALLDDVEISFPLHIGLYSPI